MKVAAILAIACFIPGVAHAGAWTLPENVAQVISTSTVSSADKSYDAHGHATEPVRFRKSFMSIYTEYGWNDWLTLIAIPEYADAVSAFPGLKVQKARDFAISGGARVRLFDGAGVFSLQAMARSAGAFELDTSFRQKPGEDFELRALYGTHFALFGRDGCLDVQIAQRWATGGRPDEVPVDVTLLYDVGWQTQVLLQNFNVISEGHGRPPFDAYRYHKLALSAVRHLWGRTSLQAGGFISPAGRNALEERGVFLSMWTRF
ncbi:MAG: hypothetical protein ACTHLR_10870 [Rhizomicrobium sp.]